MISFLRSNFEECWDMAAFRRLHPWAALCCLLKSGEAPVPQVCHHDRGK